ncbi:MAG: TGS domain-containing protein, partial [Nitrospirae bacterium]|nr:TGS domain-containing protein [Nitrospirota bacterium]
RGDLYTVKKEGAAQIALVGFPNSGKSSLLACLTNATPVIADYPISTLTPLPGMMPFEDIQIQLVDLPPIGNESTDGWVSGILRYADALLTIVDISEDPEVQAELLIEQLKRWNIHIIKISNSQFPISKPLVGVFKRALLVANKKIIRAYSKPPGKEPDLSTPFTIPSGSSVLDLASSIHKDFVYNFKYARIWGSAKFDGQRVEKNYILKDRDIVEFSI